MAKTDFRYFTMSIGGSPWILDAILFWLFWFWICCRCLSRTAKIRHWIVGMAMRLANARTNPPKLAVIQNHGFWALQKDITVKAVGANHIDRLAMMQRCQVTRASYRRCSANVRYRSTLTAATVITDINERKELNRFLTRKLRHRCWGLYSVHLQGKWHNKAEEVIPQTSL